MTSERLPPHDLDAEEAVISSLLVDGTAIHKIGTILQDAEPFYHEPNRWLYQACLSLYQRNEAINQITVAQRSTSAAERFWQEAYPNLNVCQPGACVPHERSSVSWMWLLGGLLNH